MNRIDRLMGVVTMLQSRRFLPAERIAEKFSVSMRTVYRDIKALVEIGIPVSFETGKGYFVVQGYFLPPVSFTNEEANALLLMESIAARFGDRSIQKHYGTALHKVKAVLRGTQKDKLDQLQGQIRSVTCEHVQNDFAWLTNIQDAIASQTILNIGYRNNLNEVTSRAVEPIGLVFYALNWHLIAWCWHRNDYRDFRVSRILRLSDTGLPFKKTDHIELNAYMKLLPVNY